MTNDLNIFNATAADFSHSCVDHRHCSIGQCRAVPVQEDQERIRRSHRFGRQGILNTRERGKEVVAACSGFSRLIGFGPVTNIGLFLNPAVVVCLRGSSILSCHVAAAIGKGLEKVFTALQHLRQIGSRHGPRGMAGIVIRCPRQHSFTGRCALGLPCEGVRARVVADFVFLFRQSNISLIKSRVEGRARRRKSTRLTQLGSRASREGKRYNGENGRFEIDVYGLNP